MTVESLDGKLRSADRHDARPWTSNDWQIELLVHRTHTRNAFISEGASLHAQREAKRVHLLNDKDLMRDSRWRLRSGVIETLAENVLQMLESS